MPFALYFDDDCGDADVLAGLRREGVDAIRATDVGMRGAPDSEHLAFATARSRVLVSSNVADFARLHAEWLAAGRHHAGLILITQQRYSKGELLRRLLAIYSGRRPNEMLDSIEFLGRWG